MTKDWPLLNVPVRPVTLIMKYLHASWPEPVTLTPSRVGMEGEDRAFLVGLTALQDAGWLMCEAVLTGADAEPRAIETVMTAKGNSAFGRGTLPDG